MKSNNLWIDMINPSDVHFFNPIINGLSDYSIVSTTRNRAETVELANNYGIKNQVIGRDYQKFVQKTANMIYRTLCLSYKVSKYDCSLSFENGMSIFASKLHNKMSIVYCDNDLKFIQKESSVQDIETKIKSLASHIVIPEVCYDNFKKYYEESQLISFKGLKEDVYIADYIPNEFFLKLIPFDNFIVVRPEALGSIYVKDKKSIVPELLSALKKENMNVVFLPRDENDKEYAAGMDVFVPSRVLNGLDLCNYADAVLTGSGTLAREAACMGAASVSFFPSKYLLSPDQYLVDNKKMLHSRSVEEIVDFIISSSKIKRRNDYSGSIKIKNEVISITKELLLKER